MTWPPLKLSDLDAGARKSIATAIGRSKVTAAKKRRKQPEGDLSKDVTDFLNLALPEGGDVFWSATANGVKMDKKTASRMYDQGLRRGVFDFIFIPLLGIYAGQVFLVELKAGKNDLTPQQKRIHAVMAPLGRSAVCRSVVDVELFLRGLGLQLHATTLPASRVTSIRPIAGS